MYYIILFLLATILVAVPMFILIPKQPNEEPPGSLVAIGFICAATWLLVLGALVGARFLG